MGKDTLKILTCGSVDDGKSTLIGHLLYDAKLLYADQKNALELESMAKDPDGSLDYSLLLDGLIAEREQGITIDVAYRYFSTEKRSFIVADAPGHEEYTRNMAVGASFANLAILLIDASRGIRSQTKRHLKICELMGIRHVLFAINKMDRVNYDVDVFDDLKNELIKKAKESGLNCDAIPLSAKYGENITKPSYAMKWYKGKPLLDYLETVDVDDVKEEGFVLPVQRVNTGGEVRYYEGKISCGKVALGDRIKILPSGEAATVSSVLSAGSVSKEAGCGEAVSIAFNEEKDISRGSVLIKDTELKTRNMFEARILWMDEKSLIEGRSFLLKVATQTVHAKVMKLKYKERIDADDQLYVKEVLKNEIACVDFVTTENVVFDPFSKHKEMGRFILIDRVSNNTSGCGVILFDLRRSGNLTWQETDITRKVRAESLSQIPKTIWFTGLSGAGKSALANGIEKELNIRGKHTMLLDGDNIRLGLNKNLGFEEKDRIENIRRVAEVTKLMNDAGLIVLTAFISPFEEDRKLAKKIIGEDSFIEVYVSTPLSECERRDVKGLYKKARNGEILNFTGIGSRYEVPEDPDITIDTTGEKTDASVIRLMDELEKYLEVRPEQIENEDKKGGKA